MHFKVFLAVAVLAATPLAATPLAADTSLPEDLPNMDYIRAASTVVGFCLGQNVSIRALRNGHQDMHYMAAGHALRFHAATGFVCEAAEEQLRDILTPQQYAANVEKMTAMLPVSETDILPRPMAESFVAELEARRDIKSLNSEIRTPLLSVRYAGRPDREFADGYVTDYNIKDIPKAMELDLQLSLPMSWYAEPGDRPHIVQRWKHAMPQGFDMVLIFVEDFGEDIAEAEIDWIVAGQRSDELAPSPDYKVSEIAKTYIETIPTIMYETRASQERAGLEFALVTQSYFLTYEGLAISLQCQSGDEPAKIAEIEERFDRMRRLCQQVANSIILMEMYR